MKRILFLLLIFISFSAVALQNDTTAYQTQRLKVNALLNQRSAKFSQYDKSLDTKTGIFGLQTKSDVKNSNEILRQIVLDDNNIFKELKILMDYKDQEVKQAQDNASAVSSRMQNYMQSIKKLQEQNQLLQKENESITGNGISKYIIAFLVLVIIAIAVFFTNKLKKAS